MRLLVVGAGGHAKVVIDAARAAGFEIAGVVGDPDGRSEVMGVRVAPSAEGIEADGFVIAKGDNRDRADAFERYVASGLTPVTVVHPSAVVADGVVLGAGTFVAAGAIVNVDAVVGRDAILNTGCTVDHDCVVGDHALVGPGANMCGESSVGAGVTLGAGATVIPVATVGEWTTIGAGAAVVCDVPAHSVCVGVPAKIIRRSEDRR